VVIFVCLVVAMPIKRSSASDVSKLVADLSSPSVTVREAAMARLRILGERAVDALLHVLTSPSPQARVAALRTLESIGGTRVFRRVLTSIDDPDPAVAQAAVTVVRAQLRLSSRDISVVALDALAALALDRSRPAVVRQAAAEALRDVPGDTATPVLEKLLEDDIGTIETTEGLGRPDPETQVREAAEQGIWPRDPAVLTGALARSGKKLAPALLRRLVDGLRERERQEPNKARRTAWMTVRAAVHQSLAMRGSRIALYDARESLESAEGPLAIGFLAAVSAVGDATCLDALAAAYERAGEGPDDGWWRDHLRAAFRDVMKREGLTKRHAAVRKVISRWPTAAAAFLRTSARPRDRRA
jgi:hypothetical protein